MSLKKHLPWLALIFCAANFAFADTIQLKDKAAVTGKILAEKPDAVVVDVGYTVLVVPRSSIASIARTDAATPQIRPVVPSPSASTSRRNFITPTCSPRPRAT